MAAPPVTRLVTGAFAPGQTGNALGRPRGTGGLASLIRAETLDGTELVAFALKILRGRRQEPRLRLQALEWLADRGWGKATQSHEVTGQDGAPVVFTLKLGERGERGADDE